MRIGLDVHDVTDIEQNGDYLQITFDAQHIEPDENENMIPNVINVHNSVTIIIRDNCIILEA